jgi:anti-sigma28 factor (negative regulator of flagellin synthesis)
MSAPTTPSELIATRQLRLRELKRQIGDGTYVVDADAVARALLAVIRRAQSPPAGPARPAS